MLPELNSYGDWPASGEIDIMESRGNAPGGAYTAASGYNAFGSTLHWGPFAAVNQWPKTHNEFKLPSGDFTQDFHVFGLYWDSTGLQTYVDNTTVLVVNWTQTSMWTFGGFDKTAFDNPWVGRGNGAPFDQKFYIIMNLAVGGTGGYFPDGSGKPWSNTDPNAVNAFFEAQSQWFPTWKGDASALQVDWVRVWDLNPTGTRLETERTINA